MLRGTLYTVVEHSEDVCLQQRVDWSVGWRPTYPRIEFARMAPLLFTVQQ